MLRPLLLAVLLLGMLGTGTKLLLLSHYEELFQLTPLFVILVSLTILAMWLLTGNRAVLRTFQLCMLAAVAVGTLGIVLHYRSNVEFELEMNPSARGTALVWESLTGAMPALAPGVMIQLGLIGLLYTYRHPVFSGQSEENSKSELEAYHEA